MALYLDADGQLVIQGSMPAGGSAVSSPASSNLSDMAPWFRALDAGNNTWHPALYVAMTTATCESYCDAYLQILE